MRLDPVEDRRLSDRFQHMRGPVCVDCRLLFCERCSQGPCTCDHGLPPGGNLGASK